MLKPTSSKVRFANGSLPELRGDWNVTVDSGDSTDSLVEEAEHYLRRSIDCVATGCGVSYKWYIFGKILNKLSVLKNISTSTFSQPK